MPRAEQILPAPPNHGTGFGAVSSPRSSAPAVLDQLTLTELRAVLGPDRLDDMLDLLATELEARPRALRAAFADRDFGRALAEVHSLKGAAATFGATRIAEAAASLGQALAATRCGAGQAMTPALRALAAATAEVQHALAVLPRASWMLASEA